MESYVVTIEVKMNAPDRKRAMGHVEHMAQTLFGMSNVTVTDCQLEEDC